MKQIALPFVPAKVRAPAPTEPIVRTADIDGNYRWQATRAWGAGPCISWTLLNPSLADRRRDDPTMWRMMGFSYRWGFGSLIVTNVYPFISANQQALRNWRRDWTERAAKDAWLRNMDVVRSALNKSQTHVAAWGLGPDPEDLEQFLEEVGIDYDTSKHDGFGIQAVGVHWMCLGKNADGSPIHPLARGRCRVADDAKLVTWRDDR